VSGSMKAVHASNAVLDDSKRITSMFNDVPGSPVDLGSWNGTTEALAQHFAETLLPGIDLPSASAHRVNGLDV